MGQGEVVVIQPAFPYLDSLDSDPRIQQYHPPRRLSRKETRSVSAGVESILAARADCDAIKADSTFDMEWSEASQRLDDALEAALTVADAIGTRRHMLCELLSRLGSAPEDCNWRMPA